MAANAPLTNARFRETTNFGRATTMGAVLPVKQDGERLLSWTAQ
jgi:hypothetical protein